MKLKFVAGIIILLSFIGCEKKYEPVIRPVETKEAVFVPQSLVYEYPAVVTAEKEAPLAFRVSGPIKNMNVEVGSYVKEGDIIAEMDKRDYEVQQRAFHEKTIAAKNAYEAAKARYQALVAQKQAALSQYAETSKKTTGAEAAILRKEADLDLAKLNLSYTVLTAPYNGYMGRRTLEPGQYVPAGQTISYLVRNKDKWITANYKETQIANIYIGQQVRVKVDAVPGKTFHGEVTAISEATGSKYSLVPTDNSAGNFVKVQQRIPVRIDLEDVSPEEMAQLRAGMMVETEALRK